jgi:uncharacterized protein YdiU (UPF0061 family)
VPPYRPDPRILRLGPPSGPGELWDEVSPAAFPTRIQRFRNQRHAETVGLGDLPDADWERHFARFEPLPENLPVPLALRYHGHQFRTYNARLGDGRGFLYAQVRDGAGRLLDLGTKGSGTTPWSRGGDGRLTLKGGVREVLATEMLEALGVDTSKSFSLFETGEALYRGDEPSPTRSSVLVRLSHSHVRIGTFQRFAALGDTTRLRALVEYVNTELFGGLDGPAALLAEVVRRTATTAAAWMAAGFVHGVLNTDNINVTGESFDYGPWRFLPAFDPGFTAAYFDHEGLYAYGRQAEAVLWNVARLREALALLGPLPADALSAFPPVYRATLRSRILWRLGLAPRDPAADEALVSAVFEFLGSVELPFDHFFFDLHGGEAGLDRALSGSFAAVYTGDAFSALRAAWRLHEPARPESLADPYLAREGPVTMVIPVVESLWDAIARDDDWSGFSRAVADARELGRFLGPAPDPTDQGSSRTIT